ncbi:MAG TPA: alpha/beta fold hydrolase, partial [Nannocystis exedens]|nr:alpha/beta fold hydrolase [Nannocystis exedens]
MGAPPLSNLSHREHLLRASDGWQLSVLEVKPRSASLGTVIAGHAMMVDRRTLLRHDRPSLVTTLAATGLRVLVPDLRGHGRSGPRAHEGGTWSFDAMVDDMGCFVELGRELDNGAPIAFVGHSLAALIGLAWLGQRPAEPIAAQACLGCDLWNLQTECKTLRRWTKGAILAASTVIAEHTQRLPVRSFRAGSNDESIAYWHQLVSWARSGRWRSANQQIDYGAGLRRIHCPTLHIVSAGDRLYGHAASALR